MAGDPANGNDENLLNQIDELKARMDRLMRGGTSTSNSALLTDEIDQEAADEAAETPPADEPQRTRVRDLIGDDDSEVVEAYPGPKEVVPFPVADDDPEDSPAEPAADEAPGVDESDDESAEPAEPEDTPEPEDTAEPKDTAEPEDTVEPSEPEDTVEPSEPEDNVEPSEPEPAAAADFEMSEDAADEGEPETSGGSDADADEQRSDPAGGSLISVGGDGPEQRPQVRSFDDLGSAIHNELARDESVPPPTQKKGPGLASRFGPADEPVAPVTEAGEDSASEDEHGDEGEDAVADEPVTPTPAVTAAEPTGRRSRLGLVVAIWVIVAIASGAIATLHFTGLI